MWSSGDDGGVSRGPLHIGGREVRSGLPEPVCEGTAVPADMELKHPLRAGWEVMCNEALAEAGAPQTSATPGASRSETGSVDRPRHRAR